MLKWLVVPLGLVVLGYFLVGPFVPRILGNSLPAKKGEEKPVKEVSEDTSEASKYGEPEVAISAARSQGSSWRDTSARRVGGGERRRSNRQRTEPKKTEPISEPPVDDPPVDDPPVLDPPVTTTGGDVTTSTGGGDTSTTGG